MVDRATGCSQLPQKAALSYRTNMYQEPRRNRRTFWHGICLCRDPMHDPPTRSTQWRQIVGNFSIMTTVSTRIIAQIYVPNYASIIVV